MRTKSYEEFLLEYNRHEDSRSEKVDILLNKENVKSYLEEVSPWYLENINNITPIYRGLSGSPDAYFDKNRLETGNHYSVLKIDPSKHKRHAANTSNYYIELMDNSEYWVGYPKRSQSIICSTHIDKAKSYGNPYRVIPLEENSKFAIAPSDDIFFSFKNLKKELKINFGYDMDHMRSFNLFLVKVLGLRDGDDFNEISIKLNDTSNRTIKRFTKKVQKEMRNEKSLIDNIQEWMSPKNNNFDLIEYNANIKIDDMDKRSRPFHDDTEGVDREVWTDTPCILVPEELMKEMPIFQSKLSISSNE